MLTKMFRQSFAQRVDIHDYVENIIIHTRMIFN
jgi:hypothetical protein